MATDWPPAAASVATAGCRIEWPTCEYECVRCGDAAVAGDDSSSLKLLSLCTRYMYQLKSSLSNGVMYETHAQQVYFPSFFFSFLMLALNANRLYVIRQ